MAIVQFRVDDKIKQQATEVYQKLGLDLSSAIRMFLQRSILVNGLPFPALLHGEAVGTTKGELTGKQEEVIELLQKLSAIEAEETLEAMRKNQEKSEKNGNSKLTMEEIIEIIKLARKEWRAKDDLLRDD